MEENEQKDCPLKIIASSFGTVKAGPIQLKLISRKCDQECAWFMNGKCAVVLMAEKP